jgi:Tfp pilus assembly protein PilF
LLKRLGPLEWAIVGVGIAVVALTAYLGYSVWANNAAVRAGSPATREINELIATLRKTPNNIDARMRLAQALAVAGRDNESIQQYQQVLKLNKKYVPALSGLGFVLLKQKEWAKGETYFKRVIELTQDTAASASGTRGSSLEIANYYTGIALLEQKKYEEAVGYLKEALRLRRDASDTSYALSVAYAKLDIKDGQRDMLEYTLQFDPKMPEANYDLGLLLLASGDVAGAAERFRTAADEAPYKPEPRDQLAKLGTASARLAKAKALEKKDAKAALIEARVAAALDPKDVESLAFAAKLYESAKKRDEAAELYRSILVIDPENAAATAGLKRVTDGS